MILQVVATGSKGNSYILQHNNEILVIEAGVSFKTLARLVNHRNIVGCIISHEHQDHAKYIEEYRRYGMNIYARYEPTEDRKSIKFGGYFIQTFGLHHNAECYGFLISHPKLGKMVFATDTGYIDYTFKNINYWLIECNYCAETLGNEVRKGFNVSLADRIVKDHMSLDTCKLFLNRQDLNDTGKVVLIHLSDRNSNQEQIQREIEEVTSKEVLIATKGLIVNINRYPI